MPADKIGSQYLLYQKDLVVISIEDGVGQGAEQTDDVEDTEPNSEYFIVSLCVFLSTNNT